MRFSYSNSSSSPAEFVERADGDAEAAQAGVRVCEGVHLAEASVAERDAEFRGGTGWRGCVAAVAELACPEAEGSSRAAPRRLGPRQNDALMRSACTSRTRVLAHEINTLG